MIPIFIISFERLDALERSIRSYYENIKTPFEIVIIDFGTTFVPTLKYLKNLEYKGIKVYWKEKLSNKRRFNMRIDPVIQDYFKNHPASDYVVTDPDIALDNVDGDVLEVYAHLLGILPEHFVVGPMLRIDDLPDHYPLKEEVVFRGWETVYHSKQVEEIQYKGKMIKYVFVRIDTTFAINKAGTHWRRHRMAARVLPPYGAKHLEWYLDPENLTPDQEYYMEHASRGITHTFNGSIKKKRRLKCQ